MNDASVSTGLAFLAGLASFLSACVLPLVPPFLAVVAGLVLDERRAEAPVSAARRRAAGYAGLFVLGFAAMFVALGPGHTALGGWLRTSLPLLQRIGGVLLAAFGAHLLIARPPSARAGRMRRATAATGATLAGGAFAAGWTPCIGPVLATGLLLSSMDGTMGRGLVLLGAFALGLGVPFWILGAGLGAGLAGISARALPWAARAAGAVLVAAGVMMATGRLAALTAFLARFAPPLAVG